MGGALKPLIITVMITAPSLKNPHYLSQVQNKINFHNCKIVQGGRCADNSIVCGLTPKKIMSGESTQ